MTADGPKPGTQEPRTRLVAGLGNPGEDYAGTRHNIGFDVVDCVAAARGGPGWKPIGALGVWQPLTVAGTEVYVVKPLMFMNRSGAAVAEAAARLGLSAARILLVYDCLDLPLGRMRLRPHGSSGGHRGVDSVIAALGTDRFPRLRVGIGRPAGETVDYVLSRWQADERALADRVIDLAADAVCHVIRHGLERAMTAYNGVRLHHDETMDQGEQQ